MALPSPADGSTPAYFGVYPAVVISRVSAPLTGVGDDSGGTGGFGAVLRAGVSLNTAILSSRTT